jgi:hypothetical protein
VAIIAQPDQPLRNRALQEPINQFKVGPRRKLVYNVPTAPTVHHPGNRAASPVLVAIIVQLDQPLRNRALQEPINQFQTVGRLNLVYNVLLARTVHLLDNRAALYVLMGIIAQLDQAAYRRVLQEPINQSQAVDRPKLV